MRDVLGGSGRPWRRQGRVHDDGGLRGRARVQLAALARRQARQRRQQVVVHERLPLLARLPAHRRTRRRRYQELLRGRRWP